MTQRPAVYTIPPDWPFAQTLVRGLLEETKADPALLSQWLLLLPTRRACRAVRDAFLAETGGKPLLLPRLQPLGDIDADELFLSLDPGLELDIPPAMPALRRQFLLARLIAAREDGELMLERHLPLAAALGRLMDQVYTENLDLARLPELVDSVEFAHHWQITLDFLQLISTHWPRILAEAGMIDAADRRNRLMRTLAAHWERHPPAYPVLAAGSTGSIPATRDLLGVIARMPGGRIVLPGLDQYMSEDDWLSVSEGHPQATLKTLLQSLDCTRETVRSWPKAADPAPSPRVRLASELMRPAASAEQWRMLHWHPADIQAAIAGLTLVEADTAQQEAEAIALLLRETLETPGKTALVVTPDRMLAARITSLCRMWGVQLDDSAGAPLARFPAPRFFLGLADMMIQGLRPALLLAALKHPHCCVDFPAGFIDRLETDLLRGLTPAPGPEGLIRHFHAGQEYGRRKPDPALLAPLEQLKDILSPFYTLMQQETVSPVLALEAHIALAETLSGADQLWRKEDGAALATFLSQIHEEIQALSDLTPADYMSLLRTSLQNIPLRPAYGTHPRLAIMGQLEARLVQADRLILAGLNEGTWPPEEGTDPFLSRPMKTDFGLPPPERAVGLAAHDFVQGFCMGEVYLTRARTAEGAPSVPARWLARLDTVLAALDVPAQRLIRDDIPNWQEKLHAVPDITPVNRPAPLPPAALRPDRLSVTQIETWLKDPYSIYARHVLGLTKLEPLEKAPDAASRGSLVHAILEVFVEETSDLAVLPETAESRFLAIARDMLPRYVPAEADRALIWPRLVRLANWFIAQENHWRRQATPVRREAYGRWTVQPGTRPFTLSGIADRIDRLADGTAALIDYKSGAGGLSLSGIKSASLPQLPLEALMLAEGAFEPDTPRQKTGTLSYWIVNGGKVPGDVKTLDDPPAIETAVRLAEAALYELIRTFEQPETPYYALPVLSRAPRFNDYAHLSRVQEWTALDEGEEAA